MKGEIIVHANSHSGPVGMCHKLWISEMEVCLSLSRVRVFLGYEEIGQWLKTLFFRRTWVQFPHAHGSLELFVNSSSWELDSSSNFPGHQYTHDTQTLMQAKFSYTQGINKSIKKQVLLLFWISHQVPFSTSEKNSNRCNHPVM